MASTDFLAFANDPLANVVTQAAYLAAASGGGYVQEGFSSGLAQSNQLNKAWRQSSVIAAALTQFLVNTLNQNVTDAGGAGSITAITAQILSAVQAAAASSAPPLKPQGRLTLTTGVPVLQADVIGSTVAYYTAVEGNQFPVWNGSQFVNLTFATDLTLTLTGAASANAIVDVFGLSNSGAAAIGFGPVWATSTAGAGNRGSGAGTTQLVRKNGLWVNANTITLLNGGTTFSAIPANQATYLGSLFIDGTAGQVTFHVSYGQNRKAGVWNAWNRKPIILKGGDPTASWTYNSTTIRPSNNNAANAISLFTGLPEEFVLAQFKQAVGVSSGTDTAEIGIGFNSTTAFTSFAPSVIAGVTGTFSGNIAYGEYAVPPSLGVNTVTALEKAVVGTLTFNGTELNMMLTAAYLG